MNYKLVAWVRGLKYPVINYQKEYPGDKTVNHANGELSKPNQDPDRWPENLYIGTRYLGSGRDENGEYDTILVYLGHGYFKLISKVY